MSDANGAITVHRAGGLKAGDKVRLVTPDIARLDGAEGVVVGLEPWGAHVATRAAATGRFRAGWDEMAIMGPSGRDMGYTGDTCIVCESVRMKRNGNCLLCEACGATTGC